MLCRDMNKFGMCKFFEGFFLIEQRRLLIETSGPDLKRVYMKKRLPNEGTAEDGLIYFQRLTSKSS